MAGVAPRPKSVLLIACGALARELKALQRLGGWDHVAIHCLPAELHNRPEKIPGAVRATLDRSRGLYQRIFVAYADCGTGGLLDAVLREYGVERLPAADWQLELPVSLEHMRELLSYVLECAECRWASRAA